MSDSGPVGRRGWFVTFEGPDGSGKTTQAERLVARARSAGVACTATREPGGTVVGERIRAMVLAQAGDEAGGEAGDLTARTDALLFNAARSQLVGEVIGPALVRGDLVVCARFGDSTLAYQGYGSGLPLADLRSVEAFATGGLRPDLTILLDLPAEDGLDRKAAELTRFESEFDLAFHRRVREGFLALAAAEPVRFAVLDARASVEVLERRVLVALARLPDPAGGLERIRTGDRH